MASNPAYIIPTAQYYRPVLSDQPEPSWWRSFEARLLLGALALRLLYLATILDNPYFTVPITDEAMYDTWARTPARPGWSGCSGTGRQERKNRSAVPPDHVPSCAIR